MSDDEFDDEDEQEEDELEAPYNPEPPPMAAAPQLDVAANFEQQVAPDVSGVHNVDREADGPQTQLEEPPAYLRPEAGFTHFEPPEDRDRRDTVEDMGTGTTPRSLAMTGLGEPAAPMSPATPLGQSMGHSSVGEELDVNTEALIEETIERLSFVHGVQGVLIVDRDGLVIRTTLPTSDAARYASNMLPLLERAQQVAESIEGPKSELRMLCVRTRKHEMLLCTERSMLFSILILQDPNAETVPPVLRAEGR